LLLLDPVYRYVWQKGITQVDQYTISYVIYSYSSIYWFLQ
jgi:hypothetical protein